MGHFCEKKGFSLNFLRSIYHRAFICNVLIAVSEDKTPIDKGQGRSGHFCKIYVNMVFAHYLEDCLSKRTHISHTN